MGSVSSITFVLHHAAVPGMSYCPAQNMLDLCRAIFVSFTNYLGQSSRSALPQSDYKPASYNSLHAVVQKRQ